MDEKIKELKQSPVYDLSSSPLESDYIAIIESIPDIFKEIYLEGLGKYDLCEPNALDELNLKDIYVKYKTSLLRTYLLYRMPENILKNLTIHTSFNDKKSMIGIEFAIEDYCIGIQIEGMQYRYFTVVDGVSNDTYRKMDELFGTEITFDTIANQIIKDLGMGFKALNKLHEKNWNCATK